MLKSIQHRTAKAYWMAVGILLSTMDLANAQGGAAAPAPHPHHWRYIIGAVVVVAIIIYFATRGKSAPKAADQPEQQ